MWRPYEIRDADVFWHLATGRWIVNNLEIPYTDPFSFTAVGKWVNHEWLFQLLWRYVQMAGGVWLLYATKAILYTAALVLPGLWAFLRGASLPAVVSSASLLFFASLPFSEYRPVAVSLVLFACTCELSARIRDSYRHVRWMLPTLFFLWANLHATFPIGLVAVAVFGVIYVLRDKFPWKSAALLLLACMVATILNPYYWGVWSVPYKVAGSQLFMTANQEWRPPDFSHEFAVFYGTLPVLAAAVFIQRRDLLKPTIVLAVLLVLASLKSRRMIPFYCVAAVPVLARAFTLSASAMVRPGRSLFLNGALVCSMSILLWWGYGVYRLPGRVVRTPDGLPFLNGAFPLDCIRTMQSGADGGNVFNDYNHGGFLHYTAGPQWKVFIDGRNDLFGPRHTWLYTQLALSQIPWRETFEAMEVTAAIISYDTVVQRPNIALELGSSGEQWLLADFDDAGILFMRRTAVPLKWQQENEFRFVKPMLLYQEQRELIAPSSMSGFLEELQRRVSRSRCRIAELLLSEALYDTGETAEARRVIERAVSYFGKDAETERLRSKFAQ